MQDSRRYRVMGVLGEGGFGRVYRAQMVGAEGFVKDVAIKLLHDREVPEDTLMRFRDEARILGLVRDRAVVGVEPPIQLGGRWAVVMDFVDGASAKRLLKLGPFPVRVVAEVVHEIARALDHVYHQPGPDGGALQLLHRDIKPENIQVSRYGEVKLLDFGIARARFDNREAKTTNHIGGTLGYIAPERLHRQEGPEGDVYSLGVTAHVLLTASKPNRIPPRFDEDGSDFAAMMELAMRMRHAEPGQRPTAREVQDVCEGLLRKLEGDSLREWAEKRIGEASQLQKDDLVGEILNETARGMTLDHSMTGMPTRRGSWLPWMMVLTLLGLLLALGALSLTAVGGAGFLYWTAGVGTVAALRPTPPPPTIDVGSVDVPVRIERQPGSPPVVRPVSDGTSEPAPAAVTRLVAFSSSPQGAVVEIDGRRVGMTPLFNHAVSDGRHRVVLSLGGESIRRTITIGRRRPTRFVWKGGDSWLVFSD